MKKTSIRVWDLPTRIFHWTLAGSFLVAYLSGESERWVKVHVVAGYTLVGLILFRLVWGLAGTRYARFSSFWPDLAGIKRHVQGLLRGVPRTNRVIIPSARWPFRVCSCWESSPVSAVG